MFAFAIRRLRVQASRVPACARATAVGAAHQWRISRNHSKYSNGVMCSNPIGGGARCVQLYCYYDCYEIVTLPVLILLSIDNCLISAWDFWLGLFFFSSRVSGVKMLFAARVWDVRLFFSSRLWGARRTCHSKYKFSYIWRHTRHSECRFSYTRRHTC